MFTGIIEKVGRIKQIDKKANNLILTIESALSPELKIDQSVSHNGICLTVINKDDHAYQVEAIEETIKKSSLESLSVGDTVNLERAMKMGDRLDGHMVQGHVDTIIRCVSRDEKNGSNEFTFSYDRQFASLIVEKGSICINGVSLTVFNVTDDTFTVAIIPYTLEHTNFKNIQVEGICNVEFDIIGKYIKRNNMFT